MKIVICGAGEVGSHAAEVLAEAGHSVTVIDRSAERLRAIEDSMDVRTLPGNCAEAERLEEAGVTGADLLVAATDSDEINLLTGSIGKGLGAAKAIARVHHRAYFEDRGLDYRTHFGLDLLICPEYSTAAAIARTLRNPAALAIEHFARGKVEMQEFQVSDDAAALGKPLRGLKLPTGTRLAAVARDEAVFLPEADTVLQPGDRVILVGNSDVFFEAREIFQKGHQGRRKIVLMGGPPMAVWLCRALRDRNLSIRLFETNRERALGLAEKLDWVTVIQADPTDRSVFAEEQLGLADVFIGLLNDEEANIIGCVLAKTMGVTEVMAVVQRSTYFDLLYHIGVDRPISPRRVAVREIEQVLDDRPLQLIASLAEGEVDACRVRVTPGASAIGQALKDIPLTPDWMIAAVRRDETVWVPAADDTIEAGDTVLVIGRHGQEKSLRTFLLAK